MQCREQPGFHFGLVAQLMTFGRPDIKRFLSQVTGIGFIVSETEGKLVQWLVEPGHHAFKLQFRTHDGAAMLRVTSHEIVPGEPRDASKISERI